MSIRNWRPDRDFAMIHNNFLRASTDALGLSAFRVGAFIASHGEDFRLTQQGIAKMLGMSRTTVSGALTALEEAGYLCRVMRRDERGHRDADELWFSSVPLTEEQRSEILCSKSERWESERSESGPPKKINSEEDELEEDQKDLPSPDGDGGLFPDLDPPQEKRKGAPTNDDLDAEFEAWWPHYPRKVGKQAAVRAYRAVRKAGAKPDVLVSAVQQHAARWKIQRTETRFIPHPATWLNGGRFEDDPVEAIPSSAAGSGGTVAPVSDWSTIDRDEDRAVWEQWGKKTWD